jgi:hypothetical protein
VSGALRHEPILREAGTGDDPGAEVVIPDLGLSLYMANASFEPESDDGDIDEPLIGSEIPPRVTDAEVRNVLGQDRMGELGRLHEIRGVDALGWYLSLSQLGCQYGIYIRFEAGSWHAGAWATVKDALAITTAGNRTGFKRWRRAVTTATQCRLGRNFRAPPPLRP